MKQLFKSGDAKQFAHVVNEDDVAKFHGETVHPVYSTFSIARDMEWTTRLFVLEMRDDDEEGIGTFVHVDHKGPAFVGEHVVFHGYVDYIAGNEIVCRVEAVVGTRLIATGKTGQKILKREKLNRLLNK